MPRRQDVLFRCEFKLSVDRFLSAQRLSDDVFVLRGMHTACRVSDSLHGRDYSDVIFRTSLGKSLTEKLTSHGVSNHLELEGCKLVQPF